MDSTCLAEPTDGLLPSDGRLRIPPRFSSIPISNGELRLCRGREALPRGTKGLSFPDGPAGSMELAARRQVSKAWEGLLSKDREDWAN